MHVSVVALALMYAQGRKLKLKIFQKRKLIEDLYYHNYVLGDQIAEISV